MSFSYERAVELMERTRSNGRLAHAYLLIGPPGSGKERLAQRMIEMVATRQPGREAATLDDLRSATVTLVDPESKSRRISVEAIRTLEHTLQMAAPAGVTKFAVIRDADRMTESASNAFLKTLEEPPQSSRVLLLSSRPEMLLETILSRCITVPLAGDVVATDLGEGLRGFLDTLAQHVLKKRGGLSAALRLMQSFSELLKSEKETIEKQNDEAQRAEAAQYRNTTDGAFLKAREKYWEALGVSEYLERRGRILEYLVVWFGDALRQQQGGRHLDLPEFAEA
ncbi:MAG TPA: ATP-binding protein, partial [Bacteroidia bacterium]|nr:ATP-binding protein [Bacteroidia bacterium]